MSTPELIQMVANLVVVPAMGIIWGMNGKINKLEAQMVFLIALATKGE